MDFSIEPPDVSTDYSHILVAPGDHIDLRCRVSGEIFPNIRWFKGNEPVSRERES